MSTLYDLVSQDTDLRKMGSGYSGRCPFPDHADNTPSFHLYTNRQKERWKCYGCDRGGDLIDYVMQRKGCNYVEACRQLEIPLEPRSADWYRHRKKEREDEANFRGWKQLLFA